MTLISFDKESKAESSNKILEELDDSIMGGENDKVPTVGPWVILKFLINSQKCDIHCQRTGLTLHPALSLN